MNSIASNETGKVALIQDPRYCEKPPADASVNRRRLTLIILICQESYGLQNILEASDSRLLTSLRCK